jgi:3-mercaptopyruvate sulfurtransferase SseA
MIRRISGVLVQRCRFDASRYGLSRASTAVAEECNEPPVPEIQYEELDKLMKTNKYLLIDVRNSDEFAKGYIPSAQLLPVMEMEDALKMDSMQFKKKYGFEKPSTEQNIVVYCRSGMRSTCAANLLQHFDFKHVLNYKGSWNEWSIKHPEDCRG